MAGFHYLGRYNTEPVSDPKDKHAPRRLAMVRRDIAARGIQDQRVLEAMTDLPRHQFVPPGRESQAYQDAPLPIGRGQTISQPYIVALMLEALHVQPDNRVLDVGTGSGYQTALLAMLADHVYAIERVECLARQAEKNLAEVGLDNVTLRCGDGTLGWPEHAPFDRIISGAGGPEIPDAWSDQLAEGGCMVLPVGPQLSQQLVRIEKHDGQIRQTDLGAVRFVKLIGQQGWQEG
jgi:protein-L-isoaspartate(D-aspartate) O-methyltransferase